MNSAKAIAVWIPTVEDMLEDGLLMIGLLVVQNPALTAAAAGFRRRFADRVEMYDDIGESERRRLYDLCQKLGPETKAIITVLDGSSVRNQLAVLAHYQLGVEVCPSVYSREYSAWAGAVQERGSLPGAIKDA
jgi:hypothetical protein